MLAEAALPPLAWVESIAEVVLFFTPAVVPVTLTAKVHDPLEATAPPLNEMVPEPAVAVIVPPPQLPDSPLGVAATRPAGSASVNDTPVSVVPALGLVTVKVRVVVPPTGIE